MGNQFKPVDWLSGSGFARFDCQDEKCRLTSTTDADFVVRSLM